MRRSFIPEPPFSVVEFTGVASVAERGRFVTDYHVCDARGRTVFVVPYSPTGGRTYNLRRRAEERAAALNASVTDGD